MDKKICKICHIEKKIDEMVKNKRVKSGYGPICKKCTNIKYKKWLDNSDEQKEKRKKYRKDNSEKNKKASKEYRENNKESVKEYAKKYWKSNKEVLKDYKKEWDINNKDYLTEYAKEYYLDNNDSIKKKAKEYRDNNRKIINKNIRERKKIDPLFKLRHAIGNSILKSIKRNGYTKKSKTAEILGCTYEEFKKHIESQFESWMMWENHGKYNGDIDFGWDIDHIVPTCSAQTEEEILKLNHYTNLQPLCSYTNRYIKGDRLL